jgi:hypothetical protein
MGGGTGKATGSIVLDGTLGQAVTGVDGGGDSVVCSGFWYGLGPCGEPAQFPIYLPLVVRSSP